MELTHTDTCACMPGFSGDACEHLNQCSGPQGELAVHTPAELAALASSNCGSVLGSLVLADIDINTAASADDLRSALAGIRSIGGRLVIRNVSGLDLTSFLHHLDSIGADLPPPASVTAIPTLTSAALAISNSTFAPSLSVASLTRLRDAVHATGSTAVVESTSDCLANGSISLSNPWWLADTSPVMRLAYPPSPPSCPCNLFVDPSTSTCTTACELCPRLCESLLITPETLAAMNANTNTHNLDTGSKCGVVYGDVRIEGFASDDMDWSPLSNLTRIMGNLVVNSNAGLLDLFFLRSLAEARSVVITNNAILADARLPNLPPLTAVQTHNNPLLCASGLPNGTRPCGQALVEQQVEVSILASSTIRNVTVSANSTTTTTNSTTRVVVPSNITTSVEKDVFDGIGDIDPQLPPLIISLQVVMNNTNISSSDAFSARRRRRDDSLPRADLDQVVLEGYRFSLQVTCEIGDSYALWQAIRQLPLADMIKAYFVYITDSVSSSLTVRAVPSTPVIRSHFNASIQSGLQLKATTTGQAVTLDITVMSSGTPVVAPAGATYDVTFVRVISPQVKQRLSDFLQARVMPTPSAALVAGRLDAVMAAIVPKLSLGASSSPRRQIAFCVADVDVDGDAAGAGTYTYTYTSESCLVSNAIYEVQATMRVAGGTGSGATLQTMYSPLVRLETPASPTISELRVLVQNASATAHGLDISWQLEVAQHAPVLSFEVVITACQPGLGPQLSEYAFVRPQQELLPSSSGQRLSVPASLPTANATMYTTSIRGCLFGARNGQQVCLGAWTSVSVSVRAVGLGFRGAVRQVTVLTPTQAPGSAPRLVEVSDATGYSVALQMKMPVLLNGPLSHFLLRLTTLSESSASSPFAQVNHVSREIVFLGLPRANLQGQAVEQNLLVPVTLLAPHQVYRLEAWAVSAEHGAGPALNTTIYSGWAAPPQMPAPVVQVLTPSSSSSGSPLLAVSWAALDNYNAPLLRYELVYVQDNGTDLVVWQGNSTEALVESDLLPSPDSLQLRVVTAHSAGALSETAGIDSTSPGSSSGGGSLLLLVGAAAGLAVLLVAVVLAVVRYRQRKAKKLPVTLPPADWKWEVDPTELSFQELIGTGNFGSVFRATARVLMDMPGPHLVAVKTCDTMQPNLQLRVLKEADTMKLLSSPGHKNVLKLKGVVSQQLPIMLVLEYVALGGERWGIAFEKGGGVGKGS